MLLTAIILAVLLGLIELIGLPPAAPQPVVPGSPAAAAPASRLIRCSFACAHTGSCPHPLPASVIIAFIGNQQTGMLCI